MRAAVIVFSMLLAAMPSHASKSCMSKTEARQHFGLVHIYWHGADHCWDASSGRRQRQAVRKVEPEPDRPTWRDAMSEMIPEDEPARLKAPGVDIEPSQLPLVARWVDIPQVRPGSPTPVMSPDVLTRQPKTTVLPRGLTLLLSVMAVAFTLAIVERLFRDTN